MRRSTAAADFSAISFLTCCVISGGARVASSCLTRASSRLVAANSEVTSFKSSLSPSLSSIRARFANLAEERSANIAPLSLANPAAFVADSLAAFLARSNSRLNLETSSTLCVNALLTKSWRRFNSDNSLRVAESVLVKPSDF